MIANDALGPTDLELKIYLVLTIVRGLSYESKNTR